MHIFETLIQRLCIFWTIIKSWCTFLRRSQCGAMHVRHHKLNIYAACRIYELDSCTPVSRPTMSYCVMNLPTSQALCTPRHENSGTAQAFCTLNDAFSRQPQALCTCCALHSRKLRDVSGSLHPHDEFADSLRL